MKLRRQAVKAYFSSEDYQQLHREAHVRETNLSQTIQDCLREYLTLRKEMAAAIEVPGQLGEENTGKIIHTLLGRTEARTELAIQKLEIKMEKMEGLLYRVITMIDRGVLVLLQQFPLLPQETSQTATSRGTQKHAQWQSLVDTSSSD